MIKIEVKEHTVTQQIEANGLEVIYEASEVIDALVCLFMKILRTRDKAYSEKMLFDAYNHIKGRFNDSGQIIIDEGEIERMKRGNKE